MPRSATKPRRRAARQKGSPPASHHTYRVQIVGYDGDAKEARKALSDAAAEIRQVLNDASAHWLRWHYGHGNHIVVRQWMEADRQWAKTPKSERTEQRARCPVDPWPKEFAKSLYGAMRTEHPGYGTKVLGLALQKHYKRIVGDSASKSAYKRWLHILAGRGEYPSGSHSAPIPFYTSNSRLIVPQSDREPWRLEVRLETQPGTARLRVLRMRLKTGGRALAAIRSALWRIAKGESKFCASEIVEKSGQWYAHITAEIPNPPKPAVDFAKVAVLRPGNRRPVLLRIGGRTERLGRRGADVAYVRRRVTVQRRQRDNAYRHKGSSGKGHGRAKAFVWRERLRRRWQDFVKTYNGQLASDVVRRLIQAGVGTLIYCQPTGADRETRFLARAGKQEDIRESTLWDWHQQTSMLKREAIDHGIRCHELRELRDGKATEGQNAGQVTAGQVESAAE